MPIQKVLVVDDSKCVPLKMPKRLFVGWPKKSLI